MIGCESEIYNVSAIDEEFPLTAKDIGKATALDPLLNRVLDFFMTGWPEKCDEDRASDISRGRRTAEFR